VQDGDEPARDTRAAEQRIAVCALIVNSVFLGVNLDYLDGRPLRRTMLVPGVKAEEVATRSKMMTTMEVSRTLWITIPTTRPRLLRAKKLALMGTHMPVRTKCRDLPDPTLIHLSFYDRNLFLQRQKGGSH
jgi:hypothetical protein